MTKTLQNGLSDRQIAALPYFIANPSETEACRRAGISKQTFYTWLKQSVFRDELKRLRSLSLENALELLKGSILKAVEVLIGLLDNKENPSIQRAAANDLLGHFAKFKETDVERRMEELEELIEKTRGEI